MRDLRAQVKARDKRIDSLKILLRCAISSEKHALYASQVAREVLQEERDTHARELAELATGANVGGASHEETQQSADPSSSVDDQSGAPSSA